MRGSIAPPERGAGDPAPRKQDLERRLVRLRRLITPVVALAVQLDALIERKSN
jgi:hypothetical protein